jgi:hypothetical protein
MFRRTNPAKFSLSVANFNPLPSPAFCAGAGVIGGYYALRTAFAEPESNAVKIEKRKHKVAQDFQEGTGPNPYYTPWEMDKVGDPDHMVGPGARYAQSGYQYYNKDDLKKHIQSGGSGKAGDVMTGVVRAHENPHPTTS